MPESWHPQRPLPVTLVAVIYILSGAVGLVYHAAHPAWDPEFLWVEVLRLAAVVAGVFMLRGRDWARWCAVAWMAYHVVLGAFHDVAQFAVHAVFLVILAWCLFRPASARYFRPPRADAHQ